MNTLQTDVTRSVIGLMLLAITTSPAFAELPDPGMTITQGNTALVITDPQNDFLSPKGVTWGVVGESVKKNNTVENLESLLKAAKANDIPVFISPHYYYPTDKGWHFEGALETLMHAIGMFDRDDHLSLDGFEGSGADWLARCRSRRSPIRGRPSRRNAASSRARASHSVEWPPMNELRRICPIACSGCSPHSRSSALSASATSAHSLSRSPSEILSGAGRPASR